MFTNAQLLTIYQQISGWSKTTHACFISCLSELMITNQDLSSAKVQLYNVICRKDINNLPDSLFQVGETNEGGNGTTFDVVGALSFSSDAFRQYYKVCKVTHITLEQGKNHIVRYTPNKMMLKELQSRGGQNPTLLTSHTLVIAHRLPSNDSTTKRLFQQMQLNWILFRNNSTDKPTYVADISALIYQSNNIEAFPVGQS